MDRIGNGSDIFVLKAPVDENHSGRQFVRKLIEPDVFRHQVEQSDLYARVGGLRIVDQSDLHAGQASGIVGSADLQAGHIAAGIIKYAEQKADKRAALPAREIVYRKVDDTPMHSGVVFGVVQKPQGEPGAVLNGSVDKPQRPARSAGFRPTR